MSVKRILEEEITNELNDLKKIELGSETHKVTVDSVTRLLDRKIEIEKLEIERRNKEESREFEINLKTIQFQEDKRDRLIKNCLTAVNIVGGLGFAAWAFVSSMHFEKEGTLTTEGGRSALRQLLKFK